MGRKSSTLVSLAELDGTLRAFRFKRSGSTDHTLAEHFGLLFSLGLGGERELCWAWRILIDVFADRPTDVDDFLGVLLPLFATEPEFFARGMEHLVEAALSPSKERAAIARTIIERTVTRFRKRPNLPADTVSQVCRRIAELFSEVIDTPGTGVFGSTPDGVVASVHAFVAIQELSDVVTSDFDAHGSEADPTTAAGRAIQAGYDEILRMLNRDPTTRRYAMMMVVASLFFNDAIKERIRTLASDPDAEAADLPLLRWALAEVVEYHQPS